MRSSATGKEIRILFSRTVGKSGRGSFVLFSVAVLFWPTGGCIGRSVFERVGKAVEKWSPLRERASAGGVEIGRIEMVSIRKRCMGYRKDSIDI